MKGIDKRKGERLSRRDMRKKHLFLRDLKQNKTLWLMILPVLIYTFITVWLPKVGIYFAFTNYNFKDGLFGSPFVGLKNFEFLWTTDVLGRLIRNTVLYNVVFILLDNVLEIFLAILISEVSKKWFKRASQTMIFMPYFVSTVMVAVIAYNLLGYENGVINGLIERLGGEKVLFYDKKVMPAVIIMFHIWKGVGYGTVVYLASVMGISPELHEAATVDGANIFQRIRYITLPLLKPTFIILIIYSIGSIMNGQFDLFYNLVGNNGLLFETSDILDTYVYRSATTNIDFGRGTAIGLFQSVVSMILVIIVNWAIKRKNKEYAMF